MAKQDISRDATFKVYSVKQVITVGNKEYLAVTDPDTAYVSKNAALAALHEARQETPGEDFVLWSDIVNPIEHTVTIKVTGMNEEHAQERATRQLGRVVA